MNWLIIKVSSFSKKSLDIIRWLSSIGFFFLALTKTQMLIRYGVEPYQQIVAMSGLPQYVSYYGFVAIVIELYLAIGLWIKNIFSSAIVLAGILTVGGTIISIFFIAYKINSDCGCGLLGDNEYSLLFQKLIIIGVLMVLFKGKRKLFPAQ